MCPECGGSIILDQERGETICSQCGLIIDDKLYITSFSEKRAFTQEEKARKSRTGILISPLLTDLGLCTLIDKKNIHNPNLKRAVKRNSYLTWKNRNLLIASIELKRLSTNLGIPCHIITVALRFYMEIFKNNLLKGRTIKGMVAACLYAACRNENLPRTFQEILNESPISCKTIKKCFKIVLNYLKLKLPQADIISFIPRYTSALGLNNDVEKFVIKIIQNYLKKVPNSGKNPKGLYAGAIYLASKLKNSGVTQKEICKVIDTTEVTLRSRYKEIIENINFFTFN
ncbi:MAG: transcription initiation factor IIB family protein [Promethearchaeota archaeon]